MVNKKLNSLSTNYVTVKEEDGTKREITDPAEMDKVFRDENRRKYHQAEASCPFLKQPLLSHFGPYGEGPETENLLQGNYDIPDSVTAETREFLRACKLPENKSTDMDRSVEAFKDS